MTPCLSTLAWVSRTFQIFILVDFIYLKVLYTTICKLDSLWEIAVSLRELKWMLCDNLGDRIGWEVGGEFKTEGTYVYLWLIHAEVWQKSTQYCKAIILQLKINFFKKSFYDPDPMPSAL